MSVGRSADDAREAASARKRVAIVQSCYIPWKGYFDLINSVDEFILFDDRQFTRRDWRNRNRIKTPQGVRWLSIPVSVKGRYHQRIDEVEISDTRWAERHWQTLLALVPPRTTLRPLPGAPRRISMVRVPTLRLSEVNERFLEAICEPPRYLNATDVLERLRGEGSKTRTDLEPVRGLPARLPTVSGPSARAYLDESLLNERGIEVHYMDYGDIASTSSSSALRACGVGARPTRACRPGCPDVHEVLRTIARRPRCSMTRS